MEWDQETEGVEQLSERLHSDITEAALEGIGKTKTAGTKKRKPWWSEEIKKARQKRKREERQKRDDVGR